MTENKMTPIDSIVARLTSLHPKRIDLSLDRVQRLLAALDHPEKKLPPVIHVAGTNGKGSTIAFLRAILEAAGKRVHIYTSPHLVRFNERFRIGAAGEGKLVSDEELAAAMEECERANAGAPITVFEITTAAGLLLFARNPADVVADGSRSWRAARCNQCDRSSAGHDHHARFRSITSIFSATRLRKLPPRRRAFSSAARRRSLRRKTAMHWPSSSGRRPSSARR